MTQVDQPGALVALPGATSVHDTHGQLERDRNALVESHLNLIDHVVRQTAQRFPRHVERDELWAAAASGLVDAAHRYDRSTGVPFARYATIRMRGAVIDASRTRDWATRRLRRDLRDIDAAHSQLESSLRRTPDESVIAAELGMDVDRVRECRASRLTSRLLALDRPVTDEEESGQLLSDRVAESDPAWLPDIATERNELIATLGRAMGQLPGQLRMVLIAHYFEGQLLRDIAHDLGVTEARASQLRYEALRALQAYFATVYEDVPSVSDDAPGKRRREAYIARMHAKIDVVSHVATDQSRTTTHTSDTSVG